MADDIDKKAFEEMTRITDPFDPLFAPKGGETAEATNKELQDKWMEENVVKLMAPDLSFTPLMTLKGGKSVFSKKSFEAYQKALNRLRKVVKWGDVEGTVRVRDIVSKGQGPHYKSDPEQYLTDKEWSKLELGEYRDMFAKFIREERKVAGIGKTSTSKGRSTDTKNMAEVREMIADTNVKAAMYKHDIIPLKKVNPLWKSTEQKTANMKSSLIDYIEELRKSQN